MSGLPPTQRESSSRSIPLPAFHLPSRTTRPLNLPLTPNGQLDFEALLAQIEASTLRGTAGAGTTLGAEGTPAVVETPTEREHHPLDIPDYDTDELVVAAAAQASRDRRRKSSPSLPGLGKWRSGGSGGAFIFTSQPPRRRLAVVVSALAILLAIVVIAGVLLTANLLSNGNRGKSTHQAPTPTLQQVLPSPTATMPARATATATVNIQQVINNEAAASFNSVILSSFADNSCSAGNSSRQFSSGQNVYVDLCTSTGPFPGPATVTIRQAGTIVYVLASQIYLSPISSYYFFRYGLAAGTYDMVVTMPVNGRIAVARDLVFYVS
jgi:hypothetical protein